MRVPLCIGITCYCRYVWCCARPLREDRHQLAPLRTTNSTTAAARRILSSAVHLLARSPAERGRVRSRGGGLGVADVPASDSDAGWMPPLRVVTASALVSRTSGWSTWEAQTSSCSRTTSAAAAWRWSMWWPAPARRWRAAAIGARRALYLGMPLFGPLPSGRRSNPRARATNSPTGRDHPPVNTARVVARAARANQHGQVGAIRSPERSQHRPESELGAAHRCGAAPPPVTDADGPTTCPTASARAACCSRQRIDHCSTSTHCPVETASPIRHSITIDGTRYRPPIRTPGNVPPRSRRYSVDSSSVRTSAACATVRNGRLRSVSRRRGTADPTPHSRADDPVPRSSVTPITPP